MTMYKYKNQSPQIGESCFIAASSDIAGDVSIGDQSSVWFNSVIRGDVAPVSIGTKTNIQDLSMLHVTGGIPLTIGSEVSIGHRVMLHSCIIEDNCLIGMSATILDNVIVGRNSLVAAGSLLPPGKIYPPGSFIMGSPATVKRPLTSDELKEYGEHYQKYMTEREAYLTEVQLIDLES